MASLGITTRSFTAWPVSGAGSKVTVANPSATVPIYVQTVTSGGAVFAVSKIQPASQVDTAFPVGGTCRAFAGQNITSITVT